MIKDEFLDIIKQGAEVWNQWKAQKPEMRVDLSNAVLPGAELDGADLSNTILSHANLRGASLNGANFKGSNLLEVDLIDAELHKAIFAEAAVFNSNLYRANLSFANFEQARLTSSNFNRADLRNANLRKADLSWASFVRANLRRADLSGANLTYSTLVEAKLNKANLSGCLIYGISAWGMKVNDQTIQTNLVITPENKSVITVDNIEVAEFIYLLLNYRKIRAIIDTITSKVVLILGRFTSERKIVLEAIQDELRRLNYSPVLFDFEKPLSRDITETVSTLAHMARFVIADITDAKSIPQELSHIVPFLPSVPIQPLLLSTDYEYGMFEHFKRYPSVLEVYRYKNTRELILNLRKEIIPSVEAKTKELQNQK